MNTPLNIVIIAASNVTPANITTLGQKEYTGSNHLGNVLVTFTNRKLPVDANNDLIIDAYIPDVISANDYAPFGSLLTERTFKKGTYPNTFNGKRDDAELNMQDYGMRMYSPQERIFPSVDPVSFKYPYLTPYQFASNSPIVGVDLDGLELNIPSFGLHITASINKISFKGLFKNTEIGFSSAMTGNNYGFTNQLKVQINYSEASKLNTYTELKIGKDLFGYEESETATNPSTTSSYVLTVSGKGPKISRTFESSTGTEFGDANIKTANEKNDQISELTSGIVIEKEAKDFESTVEEAKDFQKTMKEELKNSPLENKKTFFAKPETPILKQKTIIEVIKDLKTTQKSLAPKLNFKSSSIPAPKTKSFY